MTFIYVCLGCEIDAPEPFRCEDCDVQATEMTRLAFLIRDVEAALFMVPCMRKRGRCRSDGRPFQCARCGGLRAAREAIDEIAKVS